MKKLLTPKDVADILQLKPDTAQRMMRDGVIPSAPVSGNKRKQYRTTEESLQLYISGGVKAPQKVHEEIDLSRGMEILRRYGY